MSALSVDTLHKLLICDPDAGKLWWRERGPEWFQSDARAQMWNSRWAGKPALNAAQGSGYLMGRIFAKGYLAHRVIFAMCSGQWPEQEVDHINGVRTDNRFLNLREVDRVQNSQNMKINARNTSGRVGVHWIGARGKWLASIRADGRSISLGYFTDLEDARAAREEAEIEHGFHKNHGRAA